MWEERDGARADAVLARAPHTDTYRRVRGASAAGVGVGMHSHGPRQSPRPLPPRARHTLTTRKPHAHAAPKHDASSVWSPRCRPRTKLTPLTPPTSSAVLRGRACSPPSPPPCVCPAPPPPTAGGRRVFVSTSLHGVYQILPRSTTTRRASRDNLRFIPREATTDISQVRLHPPFGDGGGAESGCGCRF